MNKSIVVLIFLFLGQTSFAGVEKLFDCRSLKDNTGPKQDCIIGSFGIFNEIHLKKSDFDKTKYDCLSKYDKAKNKSMKIVAACLAKATGAKSYKFLLKKISKKSRSPMGLVAKTCKDKNDFRCLHLFSRVIESQRSFSRAKKNRRLAHKFIPAKCRKLKGMQLPSCLKDFVPGKSY